MATENCWRARKIQAELMKLGIRVSLATVSRYIPKTKANPSQQQRWMTFLRNHKDVIAGMDFFVVPTVRFRLLYVWFAIDHGRRRILHFIRRLLREYVDYYNDERVHTSISDSPSGRDVESRPSDRAKVIGFPRLGGLHHRHAWLLVDQLDRRRG
ncbi:MAG: hypothetical protein JRG80_23480 [Deltaproteobacteria bacterium]|nr:hypothetical protein [Deltaproteobacteria bacterium]